MSAITIFYCLNYAMVAKIVPERKSLILSMAALGLNFKPQITHDGPMVKFEPAFY